MYAFLADIHLGANIPNDDIENSINFYFDILKNHKEECHMLFICGDLFDHRLTVDELSFASRILVKLVCNHCRKDGTNVPVTMIHGTYSHDQNQYTIFIPIIEKLTGVAINYIDTHQSFVLPNGKTCLALPQEYGDINYDSFFNKKYDIIIGHGPMSSLTSAPCPVGASEICMSADQLSEISNICVFGHYHCYTNFGGNVLYAGNMLRWSYGEPNDKVFVICDDKWNVETFKNPYAKDFIKVEIFSPDELRNNVSDDITTPHRYIIHCKPEELDEYHTIMNVYKKNKNISCRFITENQNEEIQSIKQTEIKRVSNVEPIPALISYIKEKYDIDSSDVIKKYENEILQKESSD